MNRKPQKIKQVLLINPFSYEKKNINIGIDPVVTRQMGQEIKTGLTFPIGLAYMAATLLQKGLKVQLLDPIAQKITLSQIHQAADWSDAVVMPFSPALIEDVKRFRNNFKNKYLIFVGACAQFIPEILLGKDYCDVILNMEPEVVITDLVDKYPNIEDVRGIMYKKNGKIIATAPSPLVQNLDELPFPARELLNPRMYWDICFFGQPTAWILPSRGCAYNCIFCSKMSDYPRFRSKENIVDEIESVIRNFGIRNFDFFDDNFNLNHDFVRSLCNEILDRKIKIHWSCSGRADFVRQDIARLMKKAGCIEITVGLESADDNILKYLKKDIKVKKVRQGLQILRKVGLSYSLHCIFGSPMENRETINKTMKFVKEFKPLFVSYNILTPLPGSQLFNELKSKIRLEKIQRFDLLHTDYPLGKYSAQELNQILKKAYFSYYLSFAYLMRILKEGFKRPYLILGIFATVIKKAIYLYKTLIFNKEKNINNTI